MTDIIEKMRGKLQDMDVAGATLADMETYMSNQAIRGGDYGLPWSVYLSNDKPDAWLEEFIKQQEAQ